MKDLKVHIILIVLSFFLEINLFGVSAPEGRITAKLDSLFRLATEYRSQGDYLKTSNIIKKTHHIRLDNYGTDSKEAVGSYINMARVKLLLWEYDSAVFYLETAEKLYNSLANIDDRSLEGSIIYQLGKTHQATGDYTRALSYFIKALELLTSEKIPDSSRVANALLGIGEIHYDLKNYKISEKYYYKCISYLPKSDVNINNRRAVLNGLALVVYEQGKKKESLDLKFQILETFKKDTLSDLLLKAILLNNIGQDYIELTDYKKANHYLIESQKVFNRLGSKTKYLATHYESIGTLNLRLNKLHTALNYYQKGLSITSPEANLSKKIDSPRLNRIEDKITTLTILKSKATCLDKLYDHTDSLEYLNAAIQTGMLTIDLVAFLQNSSQSYESKLQASKMEFDNFNTTLALIDKAYKATGLEKYARQAFEVSEKSKSSVLSASLRELDARSIGEIPDSLLDKEKQLSKEISFYKYQLYEEKQQINPDSTKIANWENYLFQAQHKHEAIIKFFEASYPKYYRLKYDGSVADLKSLQRKLDRNEAVLQYSLTDSILYTFIISRNNFNYVSQRVDSNFYSVLNRYLELFHRFDFSKQSYTEFTSFSWLSSSLYNFLIKPVEDKLPNGNLIIIPDGLLSYLPFETLIRSMPDGISNNQYRNLDYLLYQANISYSYSSTLFTESMDEKQKGRTRKLLAFAPEYDEQRVDTLEKQMQLATRQQFRKNLFPIPGAIEEVNAIKELFPSDVYLGEKATESNFRNVVENYDILHLAMHTIIDNKNPLFSKLIFTHTNDSVYDGLLNTYEIFGLQLKSSMVVLSACNTSVGEYSRGEGVLSLARGFVYAGTPSLVMTMWEVEDKSGTLLMRDFYKNILRGENKAEALRKAKLSFIQHAKPENSHPFFWSSFVVLGNTKPLYPSRTLIYLVSGTILLLAIAILLRRKARR